MSRKRNDRQFYCQISSLSLPSTHDATQGVQAQGDLGNVALLEQISRLEDLLLRHSVLLDRSLEALDVLHQLEVGALLLDLLHRSWGQLVDQLAEGDSVLQHLLVVSVEGLSDHLGDPVEHLLLLFLVAGLKDSMLGHCLDSKLDTGSEQWQRIYLL